VGKTEAKGQTMERQGKSDGGQKEHKRGDGRNLQKTSDKTIGRVQGQEVKRGVHEREKPGRQKCQRTQKRVDVLWETKKGKQGKSQHQNKLRKRRDSKGENIQGKKPGEEPKVANQNIKGEPKKGVSRKRRQVHKWR